MTHSPPPLGLGQGNSERLVSRTARAKQREGLARCLFSLSPNLRHIFETLPRLACGQAEHNAYFSAHLLPSPCDPRGESGAVSFCQELLVVVFSLETG